MKLIKPLMFATGTLTYKASTLFNGLPTARVVLNHRFLFNEENITNSLDRLRRQLDVVRENYRAISVPDFIDGLIEGSVKDRTLVYTTDDAHLDVFKVAEEFRAFEVPFSMFIPVGWIATESLDESGVLIESVTAIQWYEGPDVRIDFGPKYNCTLSPTNKAKNIDWILTDRETLMPYLEELCVKITSLDGSHRKRRTRRSTCNWKELRELAAHGVHIAPHSISHPPLSKTSPTRRQFEVDESKRIIESRFGPCLSFAYPFGTRGSYNDSTKIALQAAGFKAAFLTHSDIVTRSSPLFELPRISLPDAPISVMEFKARIEGAGILHQRIKRFLQRA